MKIGTPSCSIGVKTVIVVPCHLVVHDLVVTGSGPVPDDFLLCFDLLCGLEPLASHVMYLVPFGPLGSGTGLCPSGGARAQRGSPLLIIW